MQTWRLVDTGAMSALENIAVDSALLKARDRQETPNTLHFLRYDPPAALVGFFQSVGQEIREDFCRGNGVHIQRRITGGGAIFFDSSHLGWEVIGDRREFDLRADEMARHLSECVIGGLKLLGVNAVFRPRNDIEVDGRKISGTGGVFEGDAFLFQGTLLVDIDVEKMIKSLRIPTEKLSAKGLSSVRERVTSLKEELGYLPDMLDVKAAIIEGFENTLGISLEPGELSPSEISLYEEYKTRHGVREWIYQVDEPREEHLLLKSALRTEGGLIRAAVSVDVRRRRLKYCLITGDFFISPQRTIFDLEAALKNIPLASIQQVILDFFAERHPDSIAIGPEDFYAAIEAAVSKLQLADFGIDLAEVNSVFTVNGSFADTVNNCSLLLLPYCAKLLDCGFRNADGCDQCGECGVGDAYAAAAGMGLRVITIHDYEHLEETLKACRREGVKSYIGCCCEAFFVKHQELFQEVGLPATLIDIEKDTCYQLHVEKKAYSGDFENQTELKLDLLGRVLQCVEARRNAGV